MKLYINSTGIISAAGHNANGQLNAASPGYNTNKLFAIEPDNSGIPPMQLRRMSKAVRMGISASKICMDKAGGSKPDAIAVGTSLGCVHDTGIFLSKMTSQSEQMLTPTAFIQSTHNTVAGQVALLYDCKGPNLTFTHRGHSFEQALIGAMLYLNEHPGKHVLAGGIEELTDLSYAALKRGGIFRADDSTPGTVLNGYSEGSIAGEGAAFFMAGDEAQHEHSICIQDIDMFCEDDDVIAIERVTAFLDRHQLTSENTDVALLGINGSIDNKLFYEVLKNDTFRDVPQAAFKHLSGEYATASSFALGTILEAAIQGHFPEAMMVSGKPGKLKNIVFINSYAYYHSCWYITLP